MRNETVSPQISVIVPVYNVETYLPECLDSLAAQTCSAMEVILVDDGSTDACGTICDEYAARDVRFHVIHKQNGGLVSARKTGLEKARGTYVTYVDGDDCIEPDLIAQCMDALARMETGSAARDRQPVSECGADVLLHGYRKESETESETKTSPMESGLYAGEALAGLWKHMLSLRGADYFTFGVEPAVWAKVFKRELLLKHQMSVPDEVTIGEDVAVTYPLLLDCKTVLIDNDITGYRYRVTPVSMTRSLNPEYFRKTSRLYRYLKDVLPEHTDADCHAQIEDYRFYLIQTKTEEIRYRTDMTEAEQIAYLEEAADGAFILDGLEGTAKLRFRGEARKRLTYIQNRNWSALYRSYRLEPLKDKIYTMLHR